MDPRSSFRLLSLLLFASPAAADLITGQVVDPSAVGVPGVNIDAYDLVNGGQVTLLNDGTDASGFFTTTIPAGVYRLVFKPPAPPTTTLLIVEVNNVVVSGTKDMGTITLPLGVSLSGRTVEVNGVPVAGVEVDVEDLGTGQPIPLQGDHTNAFGNFAIAVPTTPIEVQFRTDNITPTLAPRALELALGVDTNLGDVTLRPGFSLSGRVQRSNGSPVSGADTDVVDSVSGDKLFTPGDNTDSGGDFGVVVPAGIYDIEVCPKPADLLVGKELRGVVVTGDKDVGNIVLPNGVVLSGTIRDYLGAPVQGADVDVRSSATGVAVVLCNDNSSASGAYSVVVPNGTFDITFSPPGNACSSGLLRDIDLGVVISGNTTHDGVLPPLPFPCLSTKSSPRSGPPTGSWTAPEEADFFARPLIGSAPLTVDFHEMARGTWVRYNWTFGDGGTSTQKNPAHTYTTAGTYTVSLTVSRSRGAFIDTETKSFYVQALPPLGIADGGLGSPGGSSRPRASAELRPGGNPVCYACDLPVLGKPWTARVDTTLVPGARFSLVVGYEAPLAMSQLNALLVDPASPQVFVSALPSAGGLDEHRLAIPDNTSLLGRSIYTQAFVLGNDGLRCCNAIDLRIGF